MLVRIKQLTPEMSTLMNNTVQYLLIFVCPLFKFNFFYITQ